MLNIQVKREDPAPLYRQIFHQIRELILSGQLPPAHRLPPERRLAEALGVTRSTVINAYEELKSQGLVDARVGHGTVVLHAKNPPPVDGEPVRSIAWNHYFRDEGLRPPDPLVRNLLEMATRPDVISLAIGLPSPRHLPVALIRDLMSRTLDEAGPQALLQTPTEGLLSLRDALSRWLTTRGIGCTAEDLIILSGSQQGLHLAARIFVNPGDTIIVEAPTYFGAKEAFRRAGARLISVEIDNDGMQVDMLAALLQHHRPKLIYTLPTFQNPSGAVLSLERRRRLLQLAASYGIPVLEDDTYTELRYDGAALPPLKAMDTAGIVLSLGTFSKILFPGLRLGWLVAPREVLQQFALAKQTEDLHANTPAQFVLERMIRQGDMQKHLEAVRAVYREQRDVMEEMLSAHCIEGMHWRKPEGGFYFWVTLPAGVDRARLNAAAADQAVNFLPGDPCFVEEPMTFSVRLDFSYPSADQIREGITRFMKAVRASMGGRQHPWKRSQMTTRPII